MASQSISKRSPQWDDDMMARIFDCSISMLNMYPVTRTSQLMHSRCGRSPYDDNDGSEDDADDFFDAKLYATYTSQCYTYYPILSP